MVFKEVMIISSDSKYQILNKFAGRSINRFLKVQGKPGLKYITGVGPNTDFIRTCTKSTLKLVLGFKYKPNTSSPSPEIPEQCYILQAIAVDQPQYHC